MRKSLFGITCICLLLIGAGSAMAQGTPSAKFAATWTDTPGLASVVEILNATEDDEMVASATGYTLATIKVPQDKELMIGISAEIGIVTDTSVKGKLGGSAAALAGGEAFVTVFAVPRDGGNSIEAAPGQIMLSKRVQTLTATLGGVIQSCTPVCTYYADDPETPGVVDPYVECDDIVIAEDCVVTDEQIGLLQETTAAHHFNFVLPNMNQGVYDIKAVFTTGARAEVDICDAGEDCSYDPEGVVSASAYAKAIINKTMLTVQQVRAAKGGVINAETFEIE